jgi:hypothetical protein
MSSRCICFERMGDGWDLTCTVGVVGNVPRPNPDENNGRPDGEDSPN